MALLVDEPLWRAHGTTWSHLVSDHSLAELHAFAREQGLPRRSFDLDHYDVPAGAVARLVAAGAEAVDRRTLLSRLRASGLRVPGGERERTRAERRESDLAAQWAALGEALGVGVGPGAPPGAGTGVGTGTASSAWSDLGSDLLAHWVEPHRTYHDLRHLEAILLDLDLLRLDGADVPPEILLAAWFHDAVHDGSTPQDEEASATLALRSLGGPELSAALPEGLGAEVARLVRVTADHRAQDPAAAILCDADLAILGAPESRYRVYAEDVRREYSHVTDEDFARGRAAVLTSILSAERIFATDAGHARWERRARSNIAAELDRLARGA
jgi:predicted metal-dependent HD superfamily phosphohydrolase